MHRITTKRAGLWLAASALLTSAAVVGVNQTAQAGPISDPLDVETICETPATPTDAATQEIPVGYKRVIGTTGDDDVDNGNPLKGTSDNEVFWGFGGHNEIKGGGGNDIICGGADKDEIKTGSGLNYIYAIGDGKGAPPPPPADNPNDIVKGGGGTDFIYVDAGEDTIRNSGGDDFICVNTPNPNTCTPMP